MPNRLATPASALSTHWQKLTLNPRIAGYCRRFLRERMFHPKEIEKLQLERLRRVCIAAYENHDFYRTRFDQSGFDPYAMRTLQDIQTVPVLRKEDYRNFAKSQVAANPQIYKHWYHDGTSGSTGMPLAIHRTWDERAYMAAKWMRVLYLNGYRWRDRTFSIPSPHRLRRDSIMQKIGIMARFSVPYTVPVEEMVNNYCARQPDVFYANRSQLIMMATYSQKHGIRLPNPRLCLSAGETLDPAAKAMILHAFKPSHFVDVYGAVEFNNLAWQEAGNEYYRFSHTTNLLELQPAEGLPDSFGKCLITDFFIDSFPLIRYDLEDVLEIARLDDGTTVVSKIRGRAEDWIVFSDGRRLPYHVFYEVFCARHEIRQFRVIQESHQKIRFLIVKENDADPQLLETVLLQQLRRHVPAEAMEYCFEWLEELAPDPDGKLRTLISRV